MDEAELEAAGLYDPGAPDAADRLALLRYLAAEGASPADMTAAAAEGNLTSLGFDLILRAGDLSARDVAARSGVDVDQVLEIYRLLGIDVADPDLALFDHEEVRLFEVIGPAAGSLPEGMGDEILRSIGSALGVVAESAVAAFVGSVEDQLEHGSQLVRAQVTTATGMLGIELGELMGRLFRHHLDAAVRRQRAAMAGAVDRRDTRVAVGFVDLVGYTPATAAMRSDELLAFVQRFHARTFDVVTGAGGRVVKHIGDEIMFTAVDPAVGCAIALDLVEAFSDGDSGPRAGLAYGSVVSRHGDVYGPIVNAAARLVDVAVPGEVLALADVAERVGDRFGCEPAGRRQLKGFAAPVAVVSVAPRPRSVPGEGG